MRTQALRDMTCDAAYAAFAEDTRGRLAPGFEADFCRDRPRCHARSPRGDIENEGARNCRGRTGFVWKHLVWLGITRVPGEPSLSLVS